MRVLGFMSGTSLDAVDMAVLDTDGVTIGAFGPAGERKLGERTRALVLAATKAARSWARGAPEPPEFAPAAEAVAREHYQAADAFLAGAGLGWSDIELVGFHGQTVLHERPTPGRRGRTVQLGDAELLAQLCGRRVAYDFRSADVAAGGEGAPLAPIYHQARVQASALPLPCAVLNIGGVANITLLGEAFDPLAFDTGPGNGMIDLLVQERGIGRYDADGRLAVRGRVHDAVLAGYLRHPYFDAAPPKSLDRYDFGLEPLSALPVEDACATLAAFTVEAIVRGLQRAPERPDTLVIGGGGRRNPELMRRLVASIPCRVVDADEIGWRGDALEAEAFAFLAARTLEGLPISFPTTTGAPTAMTGGRIAEP